MPGIINQYNMSEIDKLGWQSELSLAVGVDHFISRDKYYIHSWFNVYPLSFEITDYAYGKNLSYDFGFVGGVKLTKKIGIFLEGLYLNYYDKKEYSCKGGVNLRF